LICNVPSAIIKHSFNRSSFYCLCFMMVRNQFGTSLFLAWLAFLLAGLPLPVAHCHASLGQDPSHFGGLQEHFSEFSHTLPDDFAEETWHIHWVFFHLTDQLAGISTASHIDVLANTTTLANAFQVQDICRDGQLHTMQNWFFCSSWLATNWFGKFEAWFTEIPSGSFSLCGIGYCKNSARLLI